MGWAILIGLLAATGAGLWYLGRVPRAAGEILAAAGLIAVAGYVWQGSPALPGKPTPPTQAARTPQDAAVLAAIVSGADDDKDAVLAVSDRLVGNGLSADAVTAIQAMLARHPNDPDLWVGLGNALVAYNNGIMSPAAQLAFRRAETIAPGHPGPAFFGGLALAQAGDVAGARAAWQALLARTPPGAPWRADLVAKLQALDTQ